MLKNHLLIIVIMLCFLIVPKTGNCQNWQVQPYLWYDANYCSDTSLVLPDRSGQMHTAVSASGMSVNNGGIINFNKALQFEDALLDYRFTSTPLTSKRVVVFCVFRASMPDADGFIWSLRTDSVTFAGLKCSSLNVGETKMPYTAYQDGKAALNKASIGWHESEVDSALYYFSVGNKDSLSFTGDLAEILVFDGELNQESVLKVESYLAIKYGITLHKSDYVTSRGDSVWNYDEYTDFHNAVAGIGKDSLFELYQKQSSGLGGSDDLTIGLEAIDSMNVMNDGALYDYEYYVWGNNNLDLSCSSSAGKDEFEISHLSQKTWLMSVSNAIDTNRETQVRLDAGGADFEDACYLVINSDGNGVFIPDQCRIFKSDSILNDCIYFFNKVRWDVDQNGHDQFRFLFGEKLTLLANGQYDEQLASGNIEIDVVGGVRPFKYRIVNKETGMNWQWNSPERVHLRDGFPTGEYEVFVTDRVKDQDSISLRIEGARQTVINSVSSEENQTTEIAETENCYITPNPTNGRFSIHVAFDVETKVSVDIRDARGDLVGRIEKAGQQVYDIPYNINTKGLYTIEVVYGDKSLVRKLVVQ